MYKCNYSKYCFSLIIIVMMILFSFQNLAIAQGKVYKSLYKSKSKIDSYEIGKIVFKGNSIIESDELMKILTLRATQRSLPHRLAQYYYDNLNINNSAPDYYKKQFENVLKSMSEEIKYFDDLKAKNDANTLSLFFSQQGFHDVEVNYSFEADSLIRTNVLTFNIIEKKQYKIKSLIYAGLDSIDYEVKVKAFEKVNLKKDDMFNEYTLMNDVAYIYMILRDNGYFFTQYETPSVYVDTLNFADSVTVSFFTGKRQRINEISFVDSTKGQKLITNDMKLTLIEMHKGDWFNASKMKQSEANLMNMGTFDITKIDTSSAFFAKSDTSLSFTVFNQYKKQQEYGVGLFLNTTPSTKFFNYGFELSYLHKNFGGIGQEFNPFARVLFKSGGFTNLAPIDYEYQFGVNFSQPLIFTIDKAFVGAGTQFLFSYQTMDRYLKMSTISLPIRFPFRIAVQQTYFRQGNIEFTFERQIPANYNEAVNEAYKNGDSIRINEIFHTYKNLDVFVKSTNPILTSNILGASILGDTRDNPFSPTQGYFSGISIDATNPLFSFLNNDQRFSGLSKYFRLQLTHYSFDKLSSKSVLAIKARLGTIYWYDKNTSYVSSDRQFFAGGANSVRGWSSRRLRYLPLSKYGNNLPTESFAYDYVGNGTLIESSFEYRYKLGRINALGSLSDALENAGFVAFVDIGNTFQWMIVDSKGDYVYKNEWYEYITGLAVATGVGIRYETPVGPVRFDFALPFYDPNLPTAKLIFGRTDIMNNLQIHFALGHSF